MSTADVELLQLLSGKFDYESNFSAGAPAPSYFWHRKRNSVADLIKGNLPLFPSSRPDGSPCLFVDIGCGDGIDLCLIRGLLQSDRPTYRYLGLEGNPACCRMCLLRKQFLGLQNIDFVCANLTGGIPLDASSADVVYCSEVMEHIPDPESLLKEFRRVVRPGGLFILTTPNEPNVFQRPYWSAAARERVRVETQHVRDNPQRVVDAAGKEVALYGHISCRSNRQWDEAAAAVGFKLKDYRRGAIVYGGTAFHNRNLILSMRFFVEGVLDVLPRSWTRGFSDQVIALYQAV